MNQKGLQAVASEKEFCECLYPWDLLLGRDVFTMHGLLIDELDSSDVTHWAPNCATFSRAREKRIPGVAFSPPPLRSEEYPEGLPWIRTGKNKKLKARVELDTRMAVLAAERCLKDHRKGKVFSLEHPEGSLARYLRSWRALENEDGVFSTPYHACMFDPCKRRKRQVLIHNNPEFDWEMRRCCENERLCSRTGLSHKSWKPVVQDGKVLSFQTGQEREYPKGFCECYAKVVRRIKEARGSSIRFLEIFSGPSAPLTMAVAGELGVKRPKLVQSKGLMKCGQFHELGQMPAEKGIDKMPAELCEGELNPYRLSAVEASRQPSYGKRVQLIPDGLASPEEHLRRAKGLKHPFDGEFSIKKDHEESVEFLRRNLDSVNAFRLGQLAKLKSLVSRNGAKQKTESMAAAWTCKLLQVKPATVTMSELQTLFKIEDTEVPEICLRGLPIIGEASCSPFFTDLEVPPAMSEAEYYGDMERRSLKCIERVKFMAEKGSAGLAAAIYEKTAKESLQGTMSPPMTWEALNEKYRGIFNVVPSFGLEQGTDEAGNPKYRRIDDHSASGNNPFSHRKQKVPMTMVDYVATLLKYSSRVLQCNHELASEDMKSAYRQIAIRPDHVRFSVTAVYNPHVSEVELYEIYGQPFGAGHAVPNFCRVAEWLCRCIRRLFKMSLDHFFDDFFIVEPNSTISVATFCIREAFSVLGFRLDPDKSQTPSSVAAILGVVFNTSSLLQQKHFTVMAKESRVRNLEKLIDEILQTGSLSATQAASLVGKFNFLCSTLFGKVGRCATLPLRKRQYSTSDASFLTETIRTSLQVMKTLLRESPSRQISLIEQPPCLLYTDASDVPGRSPQQVLGAYLFDPVDGNQSFSSSEVPPHFVELWQQRKSYMGQLEILAAFFGLSAWEAQLVDRKILLFVDNDSAASNIVRGYSPLLDSGALAGAFWVLASSMRASVYIDRVESKSNPSDGPSRLDFSLMTRWRANWTEPNLGQLGSPTLRPDYWFGTASNNGGIPLSVGGSL